MRKFLLLLFLLVPGTAFSLGKPFAGSDSATFLSGKKIEIGHYFNFPKNKPWTMTSAIRVHEKPKKAGIIFSNVNEPPYSGYEVWIDDNGFLRVRLIHDYKSYYIDVRGTLNLADKKWHFVAVTYDGSGKAGGVRLYIDGKQETVEVIRDNLLGQIKNETDGPFVIGNQTNFENNFYLRGEIDEFMLSNIERDKAYLRGREKTGLVPKPDEHTLLYYDFESLADGYLEDVSDNIKEVEVDQSLSLKLQIFHEQIKVLMIKLSNLLRQQENILLTEIIDKK